MHTHLKGRIFNFQGVSYLVLHEESDQPEWLRVKSLNPSKTIRRMHAEEIHKHLSTPIRS